MKKGVPRGKKEEIRKAKGKGKEDKRNEPTILHLSYQRKQSSYYAHQTRNRERPCQALIPTHNLHIKTTGK